jgi:hypothetical protein
MIGIRAPALSCTMNRVIRTAVSNVVMTKVFSVQGQHRHHGGNGESEERQHLADHIAVTASERVNPSPGLQRFAESEGVHIDTACRRRHPVQSATD